MNSTILNELTPSCVWSHFATLCAIPRASLQEAALREHLIAWAKLNQINSKVDNVGNLILSKPASLDCETAPGVILQGHLDMVCQANSGTTHNFEKDAIQAVVKDNWVMAENTTLGADNGIGVALALAALTEPTLQHPALEVLLTVNEECGMDGAKELQPNTLQGQVLINMDSEEWGYFYLGCAGGIDVKVQFDGTLMEQTTGYQTWQLKISGLRGGHSGIDIHLNSGNAIKLLAEALHELPSAQLINITGGTARNAIPREAFATIALPAETNLHTWVTQKQNTWQQKFALTDPKLDFTCQQVDVSELALSTADQAAVLNFLNQVKNGVTLMSHDFAGVTDTSCNLGVIELSKGQLRSVLKVRSLNDQRADQLADSIVQQAQQHGLKAYKDGAYPGWTPNPHSPLLALCQQIYATEFGQHAGLQVIHAGLECGIIAGSHPHLDMISFGPDIRGAHAPGERVEIKSVAQCWQLLKALLTGLSQQKK